MKIKKISLNTDKLFTNITDNVIEFCNEAAQDKSGLVNIYSGRRS